MKTFLAIFTCAENSKAHEAWKLLSTEAQKECMQKGMAANEQWNIKYKNQIILDGGHLGETTKQVNNQGIHDIPSQMGHFFIVQANSHEAAAEIFLEHPHFAIFPGDGVEILERLDQPRNV